MFGQKKMEPAYFMISKAADEQRLALISEQDVRILFVFSFPRFSCLT